MQLQDIRRINIDDLISSTNIAELLDEEELKKIGHKCLTDLREDFQSRKPWETKMAEAMKLALQMAEKKNTPFENAANVLFPLLSIACIQFSSRVFPQLFATPKPVKMRVLGRDADGAKHDRAARISEHMSYQTLEEDEDWLSEHDKLLITLPIMGSGFIKTYYDQYCRGVHVHGKDLVINYYAKSLKTASRYTHIIPLYKNTIIEKQREGIYLDHEIKPFQAEKRQFDILQDEAQGLTDPQTTTSDDAPLEFYEQYCLLDLDGDGYKEPYTVTFDQEGCVFRILNRFKQVFTREDEILKIEAKHYFTKYTFIPSPDGGFYDYGYGHLLSPINYSVNTILNQLIDAGTLVNRQGGFIGRGARLKGGKLRYKMGEYVPINSTGDDIRKNIVQMPFKEPSQTLFTLLTFLVEYGERLSAVSDMMVGKTPGQNTPATTAMAALDEGMKVFTAIFQRVYRGLKQEFQLRYLCNQEYLDPEEYYEVEDDQKAIFQQDYLGDPTDVRPSADPNMSSDMQRLSRLDALAQRAQTVGGYNAAALERRYLEALNVEGIDELFPLDEQGNPAITPPEDPKIEIESAKFEAEQKFRAQEIQIKSIEAEANLSVKETQAILNLAKAEELGNKSEIEAYKALIEEIKVKQDGLRRISGMEGGPSDDSSDEVSERLQKRNFKPSQ